MREKRANDAKKAMDDEEMGLTDTERGEQQFRNNNCHWCVSGTPCRVHANRIRTERGRAGEAELPRPIFK